MALLMGRFALTKHEIWTHEAARSLIGQTFTLSVPDRSDSTGAKHTVKGQITDAVLDEVGVLLVTMEVPDDLVEVLHPRYPGGFSMVEEPHG